MIAITFPGQGSQYLGMEKELIENNPKYNIYFEIIKNKIRLDLKSIIYGTNEKKLTLTENAQVAILTISYIKYIHTLNRYGTNPDIVAGHSLGEWTALIAAEVIDFETAVECVYSRGLFMSEACSPGLGTMAAILGMKYDKLMNIIKKYENVQIANHNTPKQIVISGSTEQIHKAMEELKEKGAKKVVELNVSGPFHSKLIDSAQKNMRVKLNNIRFNTPKVPIVQNFSAKAEINPSLIKENIINQITSPVKWTESIKEIHRRGAKTIIEIGPGKILTSMNKQIVKGVELVTI